MRLGGGLGRSFVLGTNNAGADAGIGDDPLVLRSLLFLAAGTVDGGYVDGDPWVDSSPSGLDGDATGTPAFTPEVNGFPGTPDGDEFGDGLRIDSGPADEDSPDPNLTETPSTPAIEFVDEAITLRSRTWAPAGTSYPPSNHQVTLRKVVGPAQNDYLQATFGMTLPITGGVRFEWKSIETGNGDWLLGTAELVDATIPADVVVEVEPNTDGAGGPGPDGDGTFHHLIRAYRQNDAGVDLTLGGLDYELLEELDRTAPESWTWDDGGGPLTAMIGGQFLDQAQVYVGVGGDGSAVLVADLDVDRDAVVGSDPIVSSTTGEEWTLRGVDAVVEAPAGLPPISHERAYFECEGEGVDSFRVSDLDGLLNPGTATQTVALLYRPRQAIADVPTIFGTIAGKQDENLGQGGGGWVFTDADIPGFGLVGLGVVVADVDSRTGFVVDPASHFVVGQWHLVTIEFDREADEIRVVRDGVELASGPFAALFPVFGEPIEGIASPNPFAYGGLTVDIDVAGAAIFAGPLLTPEELGRLEDLFDGVG